jgi:hypothetical protein
MRTYKSIIKNGNTQIRTAVEDTRNYKVYSGKNLMQALKQADLKKPVYLR